MKPLISVMVLMLSFCLVFDAAAQQPPGPPPFGGPEDRMIPGRARERVELLLKWKIIEVLNLNEEQSNKFFPLYTQLRNSRRDYTIERLKIVDGLKQVLESGGDKSAIKKSLAELEKFDRSYIKEREKLLESMRKSLSLEQWARYQIFEAEFPREIRQMMWDKGPVVPGSRHRNW